MIGIEQIVKFVFIGIVVIAILGALWWVIGYCEKEYTSVPNAWKALRVAFVVACVFLFVAVLLALIGHPIVSF